MLVLHLYVRAYVHAYVHMNTHMRTYVCTVHTMDTAINLQLLDHLSDTHTQQLLLTYVHTYVCIYVTNLIPPSLTNLQLQFPHGCHTSVHISLEAIPALLHLI